MITPTTESIIPSSQDIKAAKELREAFGEGDFSVSIVLSGNGKEKRILLTADEYPLLAGVVLQIAEGKSVVVLPLEEELSTQQAADLLNVSRPFLIKLLENNEIPFRTVGSWRRVKVADLLAYKRKDEAKRDSALQELADQAQDLNFGY